MRCSKRCVSAVQVRSPCAKRGWMSAILSSVTDDCGSESDMASPVGDTVSAQPRLRAGHGGHGTIHGLFPVKALCEATLPAPQRREKKGKWHCSAGPAVCPGRTRGTVESVSELLMDQRAHVWRNIRLYVMLCPTISCRDMEKRANGIVSKPVQKLVGKLTLF